MDDIKKTIGHLFYTVKLWASFQSHRWAQTSVIVRKRSILVKIYDFFVPCDLENWRMTLENNWAPLLYYVKLCASFQSHRLIQTWVAVRKFSIRVKIGDFFLSRATLNFDGWPWKTTGNFFYTESSFVHRLKVMGENSNWSYSPETQN